VFLGKVGKSGYSRRSNHPVWMVRGGGWDAEAFGLRLGYRVSNDPDSKYYSVGFRLASKQ